MDNSESNRAIRDAVQTTLNQFAETVSAGFEGLRAQLEQEQTARTLLTEQVQVLSTMIQHVEEVEDRVNGRVTATEARINDEVGQRIADIDAYIGRVSVGLDESITVLNDRIASSNGRFGTYDDKLNALAKALLDVDAEAIDELKDRVRSVAGEAELVRIEMERFQASMGETVDKTKLRLTEVETQLQDQAMDTETAVQLERLEEENVELGAQLQVRRLACQSG